MLKSVSLARNKKSRKALVMTSVSLLGLALWPSLAECQQKSLKDQLLGTWLLISVDTVRDDGSKVQLFGANPRGILIYTAEGHFAFVTTRSDLAKFASNNRSQGTPEENKAVVQGSLAYFGTYTISEADKTIAAHVEGNTFPNFVDTDQKRVITSLTADELKFVNPAGSAGGKLELVWRRAK